MRVVEGARSEREARTMECLGGDCRPEIRAERHGRWSVTCGAGVGQRRGAPPAPAPWGFWALGFGATGAANGGEHTTHSQLIVGNSRLIAHGDCAMSSEFPAMSYE